MKNYKPYHSQKEKERLKKKEEAGIPRNHASPCYEEFAANTLTECKRGVEQNSMVQYGKTEK